MHLRQHLVILQTIKEDFQRLIQRAIRSLIPRLWHIQDLRQDFGIDKGCIFLAGLEQKRKQGKLLGPGIYVHAPQVATEDILHRFLAPVALGNIKLVQKVEAFVEDMARSASQIRHPQVGQFGIAVTAFLRCRFSFHPISPLPLRLLGIRIVIPINPPQGILHHILHNPIGREDLGCRRNLVRLELAFLGKHLILAFRDIELVEPAYQFRGTVVLLGNKVGMVEHVHKTALAQDVDRQHQFRVVLHAPETSLHQRVLMAPGHHQKRELLGGLGIVFQQFQQTRPFRLRHTGQASPPGIVHYTGGAHLVHELDYRLAQAVFLKNPNRHQTVEPGVSRLLAGLLHPFPGDSLVERHPAMVKAFRIETALPEGSALHQLGHGFFRDMAVLVKAQRTYLGFHAALEAGPGFVGEFLQLVGFHFAFLFNNAVLSQTRVSVSGFTLSPSLRSRH